MTHSQSSASGELHLSGAEATIEAGRALARGLSDGSVVAVDGPLGAGKTTFVRGVALELGVASSAISSPSFTIVIEHRLSDGRVFRHVDAWRLAGAEALAEVGWDQWAGAAETLTIVEWAGRIEAALPAGTVRIRLDYAGESGRVLVSESAASGESP